MKGLVLTSIIIAALIAVGVVTSIIVTNHLHNRVAAAHEQGFEEGYAQGYAVGYQDGGRAGYQEGGRVGYQQATGEGYDSEYEAGFHFLYNPTSSEVWEFLTEDSTHSAWEINNAAEDRGIKAIYVRCRLAATDDEGKVYLLGLVGFETVDEGLIFIEPSSHQEVKLEIGRYYSELNMNSTSKYDGIITKVQIIH